MCRVGVERKSAGGGREQNVAEGEKERGDSGEGSTEADVKRDHCQERMQLLS